MLPFIVALILAVGLPLLPSSFHKALYLPALNFNFLSPRPVPEQVLVSSQGTTLLLESGHPEVNPDSGGSPLYLVFPDMASADCSNDSEAAAAPTCMSLTEKQDYPQPSIWNVIHTQLLYQLAEATIIIALSFFVTATLFSRCGLSTLMERLCTALLISRVYTPKAALSSFLQDVFCGFHMYWMNDSISKGETPDSAAKNSQQEALEVLTRISSDENCERDASVPPSISVSNLQDDLNLLPLDNARLCSGSSFKASTTLPHSTKICPETDPAPTSSLDMPARPLCSNTNNLETAVKRYPPHTSQPTIMSETTDHHFDMTKNESPRSGVDQLCTAETPGPNGDNRVPIVSSPPNISPASLLPISIEDLYKSSRASTAPITLPEPRRAQEASVSDSSPFSHSSCDHESLSNVNVTTPKLKFERFPSGSNSAPSLEMSRNGRRRYNSDVTCASWEGAMQGGERRVEALVEEAPPPTFLPRSLQSPRIRRNKSEQGGTGLSATDPGLALTTEGALIVPASQRLDGSMRKEIRLRPGHSLRESFAEKYLPPAARRRTSTWSPLLCEYSASTPSPPHRRDSPLPSTPSSRQRPFVRHNNSPACLSDNWRRPNCGATVGGTQPATATMLPSMREAEPSIDNDERNSALEASPKQDTAPPAITSTLSMITTDSPVAVPVIDQNAPVQAADRPSSPTTPDPLIVKEVASIKEGIEASNFVDATDDGDQDSVENQQPDVPSSTPSTSKVARKEGRRPLQDITFTFTTPWSKPLEYLAPTTTQTHSILSQVSDTLAKDLLKTPTRINEDLSRAMREAALNSPRKRKPSPEPNEPMFRASDDSLTPHRLPRARRSAPHLGKYSTKQQAKAPRAAQTPESSKRRRMRTASSRGVENWTIALGTPATVVHNGQIVLPAGTGWKGRSSAVVPPTPQRERQATATLA